MNKRDINIILNCCANWSSLKNKTVLVTGATGRLGIYVVHTLLELNNKYNLNIEIIILARNYQKIIKEYGTLLSNLTILKQDVIEKIEYQGNIDYIFHIAGLASPSDFDSRPIDVLWGHVMGTRNILELAKEKKVLKVLYTSTVEVYGSKVDEEYIDENSFGPLNHRNPRCCYQEAKRLCETMLECYKKEYGINFVSICMSHTFGPGISLNDGRAFAEFMKSSIDGEDIVLQSDGSAIRTYTYTSDAIAGMFIALLNGDECYYNVASINNQISIKDLAILIASLSPKKTTKVIYASSKCSKLPYLPYKLGILDSSKIIDLGWAPQVSLKEAFKWTMESFLE